MADMILDHEIGEKLGALANRLMVTTEFGKDAHTVLDAAILLMKALETIADREKKLDAIADILDYPRESWRISGCDNLAHAVKTLQRAIRRHAATVTRHRQDCRCMRCCGVRVNAKRYARRNGWLQ